MEFLRLLQHYRSPFFDFVFLNVTRLGEEWVFIAIGLLFLWCVNKKGGYFLLSAGIFGNLTAVLFKGIVHEARPWIADPSITVVSGAKEAAMGYSFPSGHTLNATTILGGTALMKKGPLRFILVLLVALTAFSRLYLGVHTVLDVFGGLIIGAFFVLLLYPLFFMRSFTYKNFLLLRIGGIAYAAALPFVLINLPHTAQSVSSFDLEGLDMSCKMMGSAIALLVCWELDERFIRYETHAVWWAQILKLVIGITLSIGIRALLKAPFAAMFGADPFADALRYFIVIAFAAGLWPLTFKFWASLCKKKSN